MVLLELIPLLVVMFALLVIFVAPFSRPLDRALGRIAYGLFRGHAIERDTYRRRTLRAAGIGRPYRLYAAKTRLYVVVGAVSGAVFGLYVGRLTIEVVDFAALKAAASDRVVGALPDVPELPVADSLAVLVVSCLGLALLGAVVAYGIRWKIPSIRADTRERQIDASMPRTIAFIYALSRGGMAIPEVMRTLAHNEGIFGEGAREMAVGVRDIDLFGADVVTAIRDISQRTPSERFQTFSENLTSVLQSGRDLPEFLRGEYDRYREEAADQQAKILEMLATVAEIYVTVVVAGMLFLVTILLVIGLTGTGDTLTLVQVITYAIIPVTNVLFIAYLAEITQPLRATRERAGRIEHEEEVESVVLDGGRNTTATTDGGRPDDRVARNLERLRAYRRFELMRDTIRSPVRSIREKPSLVLNASVPIGLFVFGLHVPDLLAATTWTEQLRELDDALVQPILLVSGSFALAYGYHRRELDRLEESLPNLLERLASLNEAGVAVVTSFDRVRRSDVGALDEEVERLWRDVMWGATVEDALARFERRVETPAVTRVVTLITNAMRASNDIGPVLRIAAEQARSDLRLKRLRRQEMFTYLVVIYVAFLVFLVVIGAINFVLIPSLPDPATANTTGLEEVGLPAAQIGDVNAQAYQLVFFHTGLVQAMFSGLVGGQMGSGSIKDGVKHATVMLAITYGGFLLFA